MGRLGRFALALVIAALLLGGGDAGLRTGSVPEAGAYHTSNTWYTRQHSWAIGDSGGLWKVRHVATWETTDPRTCLPNCTQTISQRIRNVRVSCWIAKSVVYSVHIDKCGSVFIRNWEPIPGVRAIVGSTHRVCVGIGDLLNALCFSFRSGLVIQGAFIHQVNDVL